MKIARIDCFPLKVRRNILLVRVETACGLVGWGESGLSNRERAVIGMVDHLAPLLLGQDPRRTGMLWQHCYRDSYFEANRVTAAAVSALDIALHDIVGKAWGVPVHALLGGAQRDRIETFATITPAPGTDLASAGRTLAAEGFRSIRVHWSRLDPAAPGLFEPQEMFARMAAGMTGLRAALGPGVQIGQELHHRYSPAQAASYLALLPPGTLDYVEEPIRCESIQAYRGLRAKTSVPFAIGEEFESKWQFLPFFLEGLIDFNRLDICNIGGFTEAMKVAGMSEAQYVDLMPHNPLGPVCTAASVHLCAAVPNFAFLEQGERRLGREDRDASAADAVFPVRPRLERGAFPLPDAPGLGVEVDEAALGELAAAYVPTPPETLRRRDGSFTNH